MKIDVRLSVILRRGRFTQKEIDLPDESTVGDLLDHLELTTKQVAIMSVNGRQTQTDHVLQDGDEVNLYPHTAGG